MRLRDALCATAILQCDGARAACRSVPLGKIGRGAMAAGASAAPASLSLASRRRFLRIAALVVEDFYRTHPVGFRDSMYVSENSYLPDHGIFLAAVVALNQEEAICACI
jgi:hypothetical protein